MSYQLLLETSTNLGFVSLAQQDQVLQTFHSTEPKSHSEKTHRFTSDLLAANQLELPEIEFFSCGVGPGSFTGIRVSVNAVKTWNYLLQKPIVEINTLEVLAMNYFAREKKNLVLVAINAFKNMVYYSLYRRGPANRPEKLIDESAIFVKALKVPERFLIESGGLVGDGFEVYKKYLPQQILDFGHRPSLNHEMSQDLQRQFDFPSAEAAASLAWMKYKNRETKDWKSLSPLYIRASEAEENMKGLKYIPL